MDIYIPLNAEPTRPRSSGTATFSFELARQFSAMGHRTTLIAAGKERRWGGVSVSPVVALPAREAWFSLALLKFASFLRRERDSMLVASGEHYAFAFALLGYRGKLILVAHGPILPHLRAKRPLVGWFFGTFIEPRVLHSCRAVVAIDSEAEEYYRAKYPTVQVVRTGTGVDLSTFKPGSVDEARRSLGLPHPCAYLLVVARPSPEKDLDLAARVFLEASRRSPRLKLVYAGGSLEEAFSPSVRGLLPEDGVYCLGVVDHAKMPQVFRAADILLITSREEQFPTVALESLATGVPVVGTPVGDLPLLLRDRRAGSCAEPTPSIMSTAVLDRLGAAASGRDETVRYCRSVAESFSWASVAGAILRMIRDASL